MLYMNRAIIHEWTFHVDGMFYWASYSRATMAFRMSTDGSRLPVRDDFYEIDVQDELGISVKAESANPPAPNAAELTRLLVAELQAKRKKLLGMPTGIDFCCGCRGVLDWSNEKIVQTDHGDSYHSACFEQRTRP